MGEGKKRRGKANDGANGQQGGHVPKEGDAATPSDEEQGVTPPSPRMPPIILRRAREGQEYRVVLGHHILDEAILRGDERIHSIVLDEARVDLGLVALLDPEVRGRSAARLTPFEEAGALASILGVAGLSHAELAVLVGRSRAWVSHTLSLTHLPKCITRALRDPTTASGVSRDTLIEIAREHDRRRQMRLWRRVLRGTTVREVRGWKRVLPRPEKS